MLDTGFESGAYEEVKEALPVFGEPLRATTTNNKDSWAFDGTYCYVLQQGSGLAKFHTGVAGMGGRLELFNSEFAKNDATIMLYDEKLYLRCSENKPAPFVIIDP